ncbi:hypothetical protein ACSEO7_28680 [Pseudomonas aeruginosa]
MLTPDQARLVSDYLTCLEWAAIAPVEEIRSILANAAGTTREDLEDAIRQLMRHQRPELAWYFHQIAEQEKCEA